MRIIRTQHASHLDRESGTRWADVQEPEGARLLFVEWPQDPQAQPVELTWSVDSAPVPRRAPEPRRNPSGGA